MRRQNKEKTFGKRRKFQDMWIIKSKRKSVRLQFPRHLFWRNTLKHCLEFRILSLSTFENLSFWNWNWDFRRNVSFIYFTNFLFRRRIKNVETAAKEKGITSNLLFSSKTAQKIENSDSYASFQSQKSESRTQ